MFETAEIGQQVSEEEFRNRELTLWEELLQVQRDLRESARFPVILDFAGVDGAGKGTTINTLNRWMDPRWIVTHAYGKSTQEETTRPDYWRYWRDLPPKGVIGMYLSGRYSRPLLDVVYGRINEAEFDACLDRIKAFERTLTDDGALIIKFWMHLGRDAQKRRLKSLEQDKHDRWRVTKTDWEHWEMYEKFVAAAERLIARTSTGAAPWHIVDGQDYFYRSLRVGEVVRDSIARHIEKTRIDVDARTEMLDSENKSARQDGSDGSDGALTILDTLDMSKSIGKGEYTSKMKALSGKLNSLHYRALRKKISVVMVIEGPDAAGKGGIIRRLTGALDAQNYDVVAFASPTEEEARYNYLWRFWRHLPRAGRITIFDRSWYGRVLVERVENFATSAEWGRAYAEIRDFENQLVDNNVVLLKFWINVSKDEQLKRFNAREDTPHKRWKLTPEDWRNREKWDEYELAAHDMIQKTSTASAPWYVIEGNSKLFSRVKVAKIVRKQLKKALKRN